MFFLKILIRDLMLVLKVGPMCIAYSFLSCKLPTSFSVFLTLILLGKNDKSL